MQYLEQRSKWEHVKTSNYVYISYHSSYPPAVLCFAFQGSIKRYKIFESNFDLNSIADENQTNKYLKNNEAQRRITKLFDEIYALLWEKLWDKTPFQFTSRNHDYSITIIYNKKYSYPMQISYTYNGKYKSIGEGDDWSIMSLRLTMLPEDIVYTDKILKKLLVKYKKYNKKIYPDIDVVEEVGGNIVESRVIQEKRN